MSQSSILGGERAPQQSSGRDAETLGPSDTSDSGSDIQGATRMKTEPEEGFEVPEGARDGADIGPDRIARSKDALDSAESITGNDDAIEALADDDSDDGGDDDFDDAGR